MTDRHLIVFNAVYETQNMTSAAKELFISQPAVSRYISDLEAHYNEKLFYRSKGKLIPTEKCKRLYEYSHLITSTLDQANRLFIDNIFNDKLCNIGMIPSIAETIYPFILKEIQTVAPTLTIHTEVSRSSELITSLTEHKMDITITDRPVNHPRLTSTLLFSLEQVPVCAIDSPYEDSMTFEELTKHPLLLKDKSSSARATFDAAVSQFGLIPNIIAESSSNSFLLQQCASGDGITIVSKDLLKYHAVKNGLRTIQLNDHVLLRSFYLIHHSDVLHDEFYKQIVTTMVDTARHLKETNV